MRVMVIVIVMGLVGEGASVEDSRCCCHVACRMLRGVRWLDVRIKSRSVSLTARSFRTRASQKRRDRGSAETRKANAVGSRGSSRRCSCVDQNAFESRDEGQKWSEVVARQQALSHGTRKKASRLCQYFGKLHHKACLCAHVCWL